MIVNPSTDPGDLEGALAGIDAAETAAVNQPSTLSREDCETVGRLFGPTAPELLETTAGHDLNARVRTAVVTRTTDTDSTRFYK